MKEQTKDELARLEKRRQALLGILATADFLELLQFANDVGKALDYRAKIEETLLTAQKYMNGGVS